MPAAIKIFALQSPQLIINQLAADFGAAHRLRITQLLGHADMPMHVKPRIDAGEVFDAVFLVPAMLDQLANEGKIINETRTNFLRVPIGVAVRRRLPLPGHQLGGSV